MLPAFSLCLTASYCQAATPPLSRDLREERRRALFTLVQIPNKFIVLNSGLTLQTCCQITYYLGPGRWG